MISTAIKEASIPAWLGECRKIHVHSDGDLTLRCPKGTYVVTTEGKVFRETDSGAGTEKVGNALGMVALIVLPALIGFAVYMSKRKP